VDTSITTKFPQEKVQSSKSPQEEEVQSFASTCRWKEVLWGSVLAWRLCIRLDLRFSQRWEQSVH
jgi:hypothetical protein